MRYTGPVGEVFLKEASVRPIKILLPSSLAKRIDGVVASRLGGFSDHQTLIAAAVDAYLIDLVYVNEGSEATEPSEAVGGDVDTLPTLPSVAAVRYGPTVVDTASVLADEPLLGLHNRDWPSLWALGVLAEETQSGPIPCRAYLLEVTSRAWRVAEKIAGISSETARKATALLPTNRDKAQSAESAFQSFAVAQVSKRLTEPGKFAVGGPLPLWRAMGFTLVGNDLVVGVTEHGYDLLRIAAGLLPTAPHDTTTASAFLRYLADKSPSDAWGFDTMLSILSSSPTRETYLESFRRARSWRGSVADSAAQGYLARGREWGLVEPKLVNGRYLLTEFGRETAGV